MKLLEAVKFPLVTHTNLAIARQLVITREREEKMVNLIPITTDGKTLYAEKGMSPVGDKFSTENDEKLTYYASTDYDKFSLIYFNRPIEEEKVQKLQKAIREGRNYLINYPGNVTPEGIITDGQHRHAAAKREKVPFCYIVSANFAMDDAIAANIVTSNWTTEQYMDSFAARGFPEYVKIKNFYLENSWVKISTLPKLCTTKGYGRLNFNNGHYEADRMKYAGEVVAMVNGFRRFIGDKQAEYNPFVQTVMNLALNPNYHQKRMMEKMEQRGSLFHRCANVPQYLEILTEIYNYRVNPINRFSLSEAFANARWQRDKTESKP
jgi:hypothetical protein